MMLIIKILLSLKNIYGIFPLPRWKFSITLVEFFHTNNNNENNNNITATIFGCNFCYVVAFYFKIQRREEKSGINWIDYN